jgi:hypothetical protein
VGHEYICFFKFKEDKLFLAVNPEIKNGYKLAWLWELHDYEVPDLSGSFFYSNRFGENKKAISVESALEKYSQTVKDFIIFNFKYLSDRYYQ